MTCRMFCIGDIHLGARPSRVPEDLPGVRLEDLTPTAAWRAAVEHALGGPEGPVDAVLLAGDVVESIEDRMAAFGALEDGVTELTKAGVRVVGVAGNHDVVALPRLARLIPEFRLLGAGGTWESVEVRGRRGLPVHVWGWSFPSRSVRESPVARLQRSPREEGGGVATLGLLHCDLDAGPASPYAPVARAELEATALDGWLLGHIHRPDLLEGPRPLGYLGALSGLSPRDQGKRGPWLLEVHGPGEIRCTHLGLAPLRYETETLSADELDSLQALDPLQEDLEEALLAAMDRISRRLEGELDAVRAVACRLVVTGRTADHRRLRHALANAPVHELARTLGHRAFFIESVEDRSAQALDLERLAESSDPPGLLARRLLDLEQMNEAGAHLVAGAHRALEREAEDPLRWGPLAASALPLDVRETLLAEGRRALEELLAQKHRELDEGDPEG